MNAEAVARRLFETLQETARLPPEEWPDAVPEIWAEDAVYREDPRLIGAGVYTGREEIARCWTGYGEVFSDVEFDVTRIERIGDRVLATVVIRTRAGEMPIEHEWGYVVETRGEQVASLTAYFDPDQAREAAAAA